MFPNFSWILFSSDDGEEGLTARKRSEGGGCGSCLLSLPFPLLVVSFSSISKKKRVVSSSIKFTQFLFFLDFASKTIISPPFFLRRDKWKTIDEGGVKRTSRKVMKRSSLSLSLFLTSVNNHQMRQKGLSEVILYLMTTSDVYRIQKKCLIQTLDFFVNVSVIWSDRNVCHTNCVEIQLIQV